MINKEEILTMSDGKDYYVINSIMYDNKNYVAIGEIDNAKDEVVGIAMIMLNDISSGTLKKVTDRNLLLTLSTIFGNEEGAFDF